MENGLGLLMIKARSFIYKFDEMCPPGNHELKISVEDEAGNTTTKVFHF